MNYELKKNINILADTIRDALSIKGSIDNIDEVIKLLNGTIKEDITNQFEAAKIEKGKDTEMEAFSITICENMSYERKLFTVAHELGHLFLHMGYLINEDAWNDQNDKVYYRGQYNDFENQANEFAAAFLMPANLFKEKMNENLIGDNYNMQQVARYFNVSVSAAITRGKFLNMIEW